MRPLLIVLAFLCAGLSFPAMFLRWDDGKWRGLPKSFTLPPDTIPRIKKRGEWFHDMKNLAVEFMRCAFDSDAMWWTKFTCFLGVTLALTILAMATFL